MSDWRPYEPCLENETRASFARFVFANWPEYEPPPNPTSCEARAELRKRR